jgi:hypothetical protein
MIILSTIIVFLMENKGNLYHLAGPKLRQNDIAINDLVRRYCSNSVLVIIDTEARNVGLPTEAYYSVEEVHDVGPEGVWLLGSE